MTPGPGDDTFSHIVEALRNARSDYDESELKRRAEVVLRDVTLLARCAASKCLITYNDAIILRGRGIAQNGRWLDEAYAYAIAPLGFPDLTMLVVNKATKEPSPEAFRARRTKLSAIAVHDVKAEQLRCVWFEDYGKVLGALEPIPSSKQLARLLTPEPPHEREIRRAVANAVGRINGYGKERTVAGKEYPQSLSAADLFELAAALWKQQQGRCALTGRIFETRSVEEGAVLDDRVSLDRIDNSVGYSASNVQLVTQFANRARGTLSIEEARARLVQFN